MEHMYELKGTEAIISPSLIYYEEIIRKNIKKTIRTAGSPKRLWPHVKSHKSMDMMRMQMEYGIAKLKTTTVAEAEMAVMAGAGRVILTHSLVGPNMEHFMKLVKAYLDTILHGVEDDRAWFETPSRVCVEHDAALLVLVDVNMGMNRIGVPIEGLEELYRFVYSLPGLRLCGMRCYDGDHDSKNTAVRRAEVDDTDGRVADIMERLTGDRIRCELAMAGGIPSFPYHTGYARWYLSPGTASITDAGYYMNLPDLDSIPDATVMARAINHPTEGVFTTDLGYKVIVSNSVRQRDFIVGLEDAVPIAHSEGHWVFWLKDKSRIPVIGAYLYTVLAHICPTTVLYPEILVAREGRVAVRWQVIARNHRTTY